MHLLSPESQMQEVERQTVTRGGGQLTVELEGGGGRGRIMMERGRNSETCREWERLAIYNSDILGRIMTKIGDRQQLNFWENHGNDW
jgi:hypothetical protein